MIGISALLESKPRTLHTIKPSDSVLAALRLLSEHKIGALLVMDGETLAGILSERDCAIRVALPGKSAETTKVSEVMTSTVFTVEPKQTLEECMRQMNERDIRHLPVVDGGRVVGMLSVGDVAKELMKDQAQLIEQLESYVNRGFRL